mmetsp:Transcript_34511/g.31201  ORF Transcript_34511/g.31201 Transcript_34511/m.31201 type:complete len:138 (-) Transcript_34511:242-655(-)|eukprot:CAMPEP_0114589248 /NCGR_PEP_ID=MMETSP0125-20121206/11745_1 /TAXON_ID=485358 ORGANISM="Aristerostoma sp., Strain ATCC 50986" /NCGR_SAMPLE_ID=MMETSP0125 /ASSEMBLY_ACC=CAM_ASM_000245 /LENGTH=137 /DNA_ID=CAMNT_0001786043 /DNA_START=32 /DNA_END=445 /DNA_ORIENTATION=-
MVDAGIKTSEEALVSFNSLKMDKKYRYVLYKVEKDQVVVEETADRDATWSSFLQKLPKDDFKIAVFDFEYTTEEKPPRTVGKIILIYWCPDECPPKVKMVSASTFTSFQKRLNGVSRSIQAKYSSDLEESEIIKALS